MEKNKKFIPSLTGMRYICVIGIFFFHLGPTIKFENLLFLNTIFNQFYCFVSFLFVLSGFVIAHTYPSIYLLKKRDLKDYFVKRFARIIPIFFILTTFTFILEWFYSSYDKYYIIKKWLYNITLIKGFSSDYILTGIAPSWSLSVEEIFYILFPLLLLILKKTFSYIKVILFFYLAGLFITFFFIKINFEGFFSSYMFTFHSTFFGRIFEFCCGILLSKYIKQDFENSRLAHHVKHSTLIGIVLITFFITLQCIIAFYFNVNHASSVWLGVINNNILLPVAISIFYYGLIKNNSFIKKALSNKFLVKLGHSTYSFYLLHASFLLSWVEKFTYKNVMLTLSVMVVFSYFFYILIEEPLAKVIKNKLLFTHKTGT